jgi:hypothetical protein
MNLHSKNYIKDLYAQWVPKVPLTSTLLEKIGISRQLRYEYLKSGWLEKIGEGAYKLSKAEITWEGGLNCLHFQLNKKIHVGGRTALEIQGLGHFLPLSVQKVFLFCSIGNVVPKWYTIYPWRDVEIIIARTNFLPENKGIVSYKTGDINIFVSSPERAGLEVLYLLENYHTFDELILLSEGFSNFRPKLMQDLLLSCNSKKVKRLILLLGKYHQHLWYKRLDLKGIDLGKGIMQIKGGGKYIDEFKLSIPKKLEDYTNV